jgi:hypothetical protein
MNLSLCCTRHTVNLSLWLRGAAAGGGTGNVWGGSSRSGATRGLHVSYWVNEAVADSSRMHGTAAGLTHSLSKRLLDVVALVAEALDLVE